MTTPPLPAWQDDWWPLLVESPAWKDLALQERHANYLKKGKVEPQKRTVDRLKLYVLKEDRQHERWPSTERSHSAFAECRRF